jgi:hypothetical protein
VEAKQKNRRESERFLSLKAKKSIFSFHFALKNLMGKEGPVFPILRSNRKQTDPILLPSEKLFEAKPADPSAAQKICFQVSDSPFRKTQYCKVM